VTPTLSFARLLLVLVVPSLACVLVDPLVEEGADGSSSGEADDTPPGGSNSSPSDPDGGPSPGSVDGGNDGEPCVPLVCGIDLPCGMHDDGCGNTVDCGACGEGTALDLEVAHVLADPGRGRLYATVQGAAAQHPNELVVIDPATGMVLDAVFVGSNPSSLALSDDGSTLWVGLDGSLEIREVDLGTETPTPGDQHALQPGEWGDPAHAGTIVVLPGTTHSVAVSMHTFNLSPSFLGVVVLDDGVPRPMTTPGHTGASRLTLGPDGWLYGFNNLHTGFGFYALAVTENGVTQTEHEGLVDGFDTDIVYAEDGRVYATSGQVVDVSQPAAPAVEGTFNYYGAVLPQPEEGRVLMLSASWDDPVPTLRSLDPATFTQTAEAMLSGVEGEYFYDLTTADGLVLAVIGSSGFGEGPRLYLIANPFAG